jgi:hypothetical protein
MVTLAEAGSVRASVTAGVTALDVAGVGVRLSDLAAQATQLHASAKGTEIRA